MFYFNIYKLEVYYKYFYIRPCVVNQLSFAREKIFARFARASMSQKFLTVNYYLPYSCDKKTGMGKA